MFYLKDLFKTCSTEVSEAGGRYDFAKIRLSCGFFVLAMSAKNEHT